MYINIDAAAAADGVCVYLYPGGLIITDSLWATTAAYAVHPPSPADIKRKSAPITHAETEENCCTTRGQYLTTSPPHCTRCWPICIYTPLVRVYTHSLFFSVYISWSSWARVHAHTHLLYQSILCWSTRNPCQSFAYYSFCEIYLQSDSPRACSLLTFSFFPLQCSHMKSDFGNI